MMSRLVLVGMVAALGITVPTWPEIHGCMRSAHVWMAARLADLDASRSPSEDPPIIPPPPIRRTRSITPIDPDIRILTVADELNRAAQGLDLPAGVMVVRHRPTVEADTTPASMRQCRDSAVVPTPDILECARIRDVLETVERSSEEGGTAESPVASQRSKVPATVACVFSASATRLTAPSPASSHVLRGTVTLTVSKPRMEPIEPADDGATDVAGVLNRSAEGMDLAPENPKPVGAPAPAFTPIDPDACIQASIADELNQADEGLAIAHTSPIGEATREPASTSAPIAVAPPATVADRAAPPGPAPEFAQAMRLTREAFRAWMKVVANPAIVQVSAR